MILSMDSEGGIGLMKGKTRVFVFALALALLLSPLTARGEGLLPVARLNVYVAAVTPTGEEATYGPAVPLSNLPTENRLWLKVPLDVFFTGAVTIFIEDTLFEFASFSPASGSLLENISDAGADLSGSFVNIAAFDAEGNVADSFVLYISSQDAPAGEQPVTQPTEAPVFPAEVTVRYLNASGEPIAPDSTVLVQPGVNNIYPENVVPDDYELTELGVKEVFVDGNGVNPSVVEFHYALRQISGSVNVHYVDENGAPVMESTAFTFDGGEHPVYAIPVDGYTVSGANTYTVFVDKNGANPAEVTFVYERAVQPASVTVHYVDADGQPVRNDDVLSFGKGGHSVSAVAIPGYTATGDTSYSIQVDGNGAQPAEVTFLYLREIRPADVVVHYINESGEAIAKDTKQTVTPNAYIVTPAGGVSPEEYQLTSPEAVEVLLDADGAHPMEVTFQYSRVIKSVDVVIRYVDDLGNAIADNSVVSVPGGDSLITPQANIDPARYALQEPVSYPVTVTYEGASAKEFTFTYKRVAQPVTVTLHYIDEKGNPIAADSQAVFGEGSHEVKPMANISTADYTLTGPASYPLNVALEGPSATEFTFTYQRVVKPVQVTVHCVNEANEPIAEDTFQILSEGPNVVFAPPAPENYFLPETAENIQTVVVDADGAHPAEVAFTYKLRATNPVSIPVLYVSDESGAEIATRQTVSAQPDAVTEVSAAPADLLPDYILISDSPVSVTVNREGVSSAKEVVFRYAYAPQPTEAPTDAPTEEPRQAATEEPAPTEEPTPTEEPAPTEEPRRAATDEPAPTEEPSKAQPVTLTVRYLDTEGKPVALDGQVRCDVGDTLVKAAPVDLLEGYIPEGPQEVLVHVDENGADLAEIKFLYRFMSEAPAPKVALVNVKYLDPDKKVFYSTSATCVSGQPNPVSLDWNNVNPALGYVLDSSETVFVTVDDTGVATPSEVVFEFKNEVSVMLPIYYRDKVTGRDVADPQEKPCYVGTNMVDAEPLGLESGYTLSGSSSVTVILTEDGTLTPNEVVFQYWREATETPAPTNAPYDEPMDAYFYPTGPSIRVRATTTTTENNIIGLVNSGDLGHVVGRTVGRDGKTWYSVEINGLMGYMSDTVVRFLNDAELAALFGYTPAPTVVPTPAPTEVPDGMVIDRWGQTNAQVNFRRSPDKSGKRIDELRKNTRVWIYSSENVKDEKWYSVTVNGTNGYVKAEFVNLLSEAESEQIQRSLSSPVPTQAPPMTPEPTPVLTPEPTEEPTQAPTEAPTPEPTEEPPVPTDTPIPTGTPEPAYQGYAVTTEQTILRTGVSISSETILKTLPPKTLVDVKSVTVVDGVSWAFAQSVGSENWGYILMADLKKITTDEAKAYQNQVFATPTVTPTTTPEQVEGYAMTLGDGVPMRNYPDVNGEIIMLLPYTAVARVFAQQYTDAAWHLVQYNGMWGFIRQDQLRMMSAEEVAAYEESMLGSTPSPSPAPTPEPITENSLSSYGHVQSLSGKVNLRSGPSKNSIALRLLDNYAFALVLGTEYNEEGTWYHVSQAGVEGYILSDYFRVLQLGELSDFLQSAEYLNANSNNASGTATSSQIQPVEDYNRNVWQNPALTVSYEPFNPFVTATPGAEIIAPTNTPVPTATPAPSATPQIAPVGPTGSNLPEPNVQQGGAPWPWVLLGLAVVGGGGAYYAYAVHTQNKKQAELRAQQARQARSQAAAHPQMRAARNNPPQPVNRPAYPSNQGRDSAYPQPKPAVQKPVSPQGGDAAFKPQTSGSTQPGVSGETKAYTPVRFQNPTQVYQPQRPMAKEAGLENSDSMAQQNASPAASQPKASVPAETPDAVKPVQAPAAPTVSQPVQTAATAMPSADVSPSHRVRRTERNKNLYNTSDKA